MDWKDILTYEPPIPGISKGGFDLTNLPSRGGKGLTDLFFAMVEAGAPVTNAVTDNQVAGAKSTSNPQPQGGIKTMDDFFAMIRQAAANKAAYEANNKAQNQTQGQTTVQPTAKTQSTTVEPQPTTAADKNAQIAQGLSNVGGWAYDAAVDSGAVIPQGMTPEEASVAAQLGWTPNPAFLSIEANEKAGQMPGGGMGYVLGEYGIDPMKPGGQFYMDRADALRDAYSLIAGAPGQEMVGTSDDMLAFQQGYYDTLHGNTQENRDDYFKMRGVMKAQVHAALYDPTSQIYKDVQDMIAQGNYGEMELFYNVIQPALVVSGVSPQMVKIKEQEFSRLYQQYQIELVAGRSGNQNFQDYLAAQGYNLDF